MKKFYLHNGTMQEGPFDYDELKLKGISRTTPVWYDPMPAWIIAGEVDELKSLFTVGPPPYNAYAETGASNVNASYSTPKSGITLRLLLYAVTIIVIALIGVYIYNRNNETYTLHTQSDIKAEIRSNINSYVSATGSNYFTSGLGGISGLSITVKNTSGYMLDNVRVQVSYIKANGEIWKDENIDFPYLETNTQVTLPAPNSTRGTSVRYKIISIKSQALGLY